MGVRHMVRDYRNLKAEAGYRAIIDDLAKLPFSFAYDGKSYKGFPRDVFRMVNSRTEHQNDKGKEINVFELIHGDSLKITVETAFYPAYGAYEWVVWFENAGTADTGVVSDVWAADMEFTGELSEEGQKNLAILMEWGATNVGGFRENPYPELSQAIAENLQALALEAVTPDEAAAIVEEVSQRTQR